MWERHLGMMLGLGVSLWLLLAVNVRPQETVSAQSLNAAELQSALMSFADSWASQIDEASHNFAQQARSPEALYHAEQFRFYSLAAAFDIAAGAYPGPALLDMVVLVTLNRLVWEEHWQPKVYGRPAEVIVRMLKNQEAEIWALAAKVMTPEQRQELRDLIRQWRKKYPDKVGVSFIRFSNFGELGRKPYLEQARKSGGLLAPVKEAVKAADEIRSLADRTIYLLFRMQELLSSRALLTVQELLTTPEVAQLLADISGFRDVSERYAELFEELPAQLSEQTRATIDQVTVQVTRQSDLLINRLMQQVNTVRQAAVDQVLQGIASERQAALAQLSREVAAERAATLAQALQGVTRERQALVRDITQLLDRSEQGVASWLTLLFVLVAALVLIVFLLRLAYRYAVDQSPAMRRGHLMASTGLTVAAISVVIAVLAYVHHDFLASFEASHRERDGRIDPAFDRVGHVSIDAPLRAPNPPTSGGASASRPASTTGHDVSVLQLVPLTPQTSASTASEGQPDPSIAPSTPSSDARRTAGSAASPEPEPRAHTSRPQDAPGLEPAGVSPHARAQPEALSQDNAIGSANGQELTVQTRFAPGEWSLAPSAYEVLNRVLERLQADVVWRLEIVGHSDNQGSNHLNLKLSEQRAEAVKTYLAQKGISPPRLTVVGYGGSHPVASNATLEGRSQNRRVVIKFMR